MTPATEIHHHWQARDAARNLAREYHVRVSRDLFGWFIVERCWGRIGGRGRGLVQSFPDPRLAEQAVAAVCRRRASADRRIGAAYRSV